MERVVQKRIVEPAARHEPRVALLVLVIALVLMGGAARTGSTQAVWTDTPAVNGNALSTATLLAPTSPSAAASCDGWGKAKVTLTWTAAARADGYDVYRSSTTGGPYTKIAHVDGGSSTSTMDRSLSLSTTYYYVLQTTRNNWVSANSTQVQATTPGICLS